MGTLNIKGTLIEYGMQSGISRQDLTKLLTRCVAEQGNLQAALNSGVLPFWHTGDRRQHILAWKNRIAQYNTLIIVCSDMIAASLRDIQTDMNIVFVTSLSTELKDVKGAVVTVLASEKWMQIWLSHHISTLSLLEAKKAESAVILCLDEIVSEQNLDSEIEIYTEVGICDERFVGFTNFALALHADPVLALDGLESGLSAISEPSVWNNPSALLAMVSRAFGLMPHIETVFIVPPVDKPLMQRLTALTSRMESGTVTAFGASGRLTVSQSVCLGEDGVFNMLSANMKQLVVLIQPEYTDWSTTLQEYQQQQYTVLEQWLFEAQIPYVIWKLPSQFGIVEQMTFTTQWIHRSLLSVAMQDIDPTLYEDSDKWRQTSTNLWNRLGSSLT